MLIDYVVKHYHDDFAKNFEVERSKILVDKLSDTHDTV